MKAKLTYLLVVAITIYLTILPTSNNYFLFPLLVLLSIWSAVVGIRSKHKLNPIWTPLIISWLVFVLFGISVALFNQVEYWPRVLVFFLVWPTVFSLIAFGAKSTVIKPFFTGGVIASIGISLLALTDSVISQYFDASLSLPAWLTSPFLLRHVLDSEQNFSYSSLFIPPLIWWSTIWFASLALKTKSVFLPKYYVRLIAAFLSFSALLVSWRRGAILAVAITLFLILFILLFKLVFKRSSEKKPQLITISLLSAALLGGLLISLPLQKQLWHFVPGLESTSSTVKVLSPNQADDQKNIVLNPSFEQSEIGWYANDVDSSSGIGVSKSGSTSLELSVNAPYGYVGAYSSNRILVGQNKQISFSAWIKTNTTEPAEAWTDKIFVGVEWFAHDIGGKPIARDYGNSLYPTDNWQKFSVLAKAPSKTAYAQVVIYSFVKDGEAPTLGSKVWIDDVEATKSVIQGSESSSESEGSDSNSANSSGEIEQDIALSDTLRKNELSYLTTWDNPSQLLFGRGIGAPIDRGSEVRDMNPWQTEMQYFSLFYWTGIVGMLLFIAVVYFAVRVFIVALRNAGAFREVLLLTAAGALAILVANATNPYLQAPGHMLGMFLPIIVANIIFSSIASNYSEARKFMK